MARMQEMKHIVNLCQGQLGHLVGDKTGLSGKYDFVLEFAREFTGPQPVDAASNRTPGTSEASMPAPSFLMAVEQQLGLKLTPSKATTDVLVIDSYHREPSEDQ